MLYQQLYQLVTAKDDKLPSQKEPLSKFYFLHQNNKSCLIFFLKVPVNSIGD